MGELRETVILYVYFNVIFTVDRNITWKYDKNR